MVVKAVYRGIAIDNNRLQANGIAPVICGQSETGCCNYKIMCKMCA